VRRPRIVSRSAVVYLVFLLSVGGGGGYLLFLGYRSYQVYAFLKSDHRGFRGRLHRVDPELGFAALPGAKGLELLPGGTPQPVSYDREGLRVPAGQETRVPQRRPFILTLGCSFTFGAATPAEDTYPYVLAERLGGTALNAGESGYGLAQMLILARRLIPRYRPDVVVVQFSPWLAGRATSGFANVTFGTVPVPYLTFRKSDREGRVDIVPPVFPGKVFDLPFDRYDRPDRGLREFLSLLADAGAPLFVRDDTEMLLYRIRRATRRVPPPADDPLRLNRAVYGEIVRLAEGNGARPVIVRLSHPLEVHWQEMKELSRTAVLVNAQGALDMRARDKEDYRRLFAHWRGSPPVLVDTHPNAEAHRIIAAEIARVLQAATSPQRPQRESTQTGEPRPQN
jgi:hypothetical protein